jgi:ribonucleoside-diphosphate reductase subunit M1
MCQIQDLDRDVEITVEYVHSFLEKLNNFVFSSIVLNDLCEDVVKRLPKQMKYIDFLNYIADYCASKVSYHPEYNKLASYICIKKLHLQTYDDVTLVAEILYNNKDVHNNHSPIISKQLYEIYMKHKDIINKTIDFSRDYDIDYFGIKTMERSYLMRINKNISNSTKFIIERPQHLFMRVAFGIHGENLEKAFETYYYMSQKYFIHATPTLFNAGTPFPQNSSCFLLGCEDSMEGIMDSQREMALISKFTGGVGVHFSSIRGKNSLIRSANGLSDGILPLCVYTCKLSRYVNQGGKRGGAIAVYLEVHHPDIFEFCELRIPNTGNDDNRARDLFLALWICDLFMKRVENDEMWSLMCPDECPNLNKTYGDEFEKLYIKYEQEKRYKKQVKARDLFEHILNCQMSSGLPYIAFKDNVNRKSNQQNLGTIRSSNLCIEIMEYSDENETAVCNLASICLPRFIENGKYNFGTLQEITRICIRNLNKVIDVNYYPTEKAKRSNMRHRPVGLGVQGLCHVYNILELPFESNEAVLLNKKIFETIYFAAIDESCKLAQKDGPYETFQGSPFSKGLLQFHLWGMSVDDLVTKNDYDWNGLIKDVVQFGTRNSLTTALMPTASTSQIMSCSECFEPIMSNIFTRSTLAGEFTVINENLINALEKINLWNEDMRHKILDNKGSIQKIDEIPQKIREIYKTAFELKLKSIVSQAADRGPFIDQSQSMNLFMEEQDRAKLRSALFYGWKRGLKTGMYYLRTTPAADALKFGLDIKQNENTPKIKPKDEEEEVFVCRMEKGCVVCGS